MPTSRRRRPRLLAPALIGLAAVLWNAPSPAVASAREWPYEWKPGWLPGEPPPEEPRFFEDPWMIAGIRAPGMIVALDPVTGRPVRPTPEQRRAISAALAGQSPTIRPDTPLPTERLPRGGELLHLPAGFEVFMVARKSEDGRFTVDCVTDPTVPGRSAAQPSASSTSAPAPIPRVATPREER